MNVILAKNSPRHPVPDGTVWLAFSVRQVHRGNAYVKFPRIPGWRVVAAILAGRGHLVGRSVILDYVYGDDPRGGPLWAVDVIRTIIHRARRYLKPLGIWIITRCRRGYEAELLPMPVVELRRAA